MELVKLANGTMHNQESFIDKFRELGYEIIPEPLLREVPQGDTDAAVALAMDVVRQARNLSATDILIGGRSDLAIYIALIAANDGMGVCVADTRRTRDENDRFIFNLEAVVELPLYTGRQGGVFIDHPTALEPV